jgi:hypothetical protein
MKKQRPKKKRKKCIIFTQRESFEKEQKGRREKFCARFV